MKGELSYFSIFLVRVWLLANSVWSNSSYMEWNSRQGYLHQKNLFLAENQMAPMKSEISSDANTVNA